MPKKIPQRMCVSCRAMNDKQLLLRVTRSQQGQIYLDLSGKSPGRGAYICAAEACLQKAKKKRALERALQEKTEDILWQQLQEEICRRRNDN
jgi:predicted RNA-binding protein YlxR (DUF448 family)